MTTRRRFLFYVATALAAIGVFAGDAAQAGKPPSLKLTVSMSSSRIIEGSTATATVTRSTSTGDLDVTLGSNDATEALVSGPTTVRLTTGQTTATFTVTGVKDGIVDGDQAVTLTASASGYASAGAIITVSDKPIFEYRTEVISGGANSIGQVNGITNNSRVYGWMAQFDGSTVLYKSGYVYDQVSQTMYDLNQTPSLTTQVHLLAGPDFGLASIVDMNESGLMTGYIEDSAGNHRRGIAIDTTVDGQFSPDPADWVIQLLPDFGSTNTYGKRINEFGDIVGTFERADGTIGVYVYNPWDGGTPAVPVVNLRSVGNVELNDLAQVAGIDEFGRAFLYNAVTESIQTFADADYLTVKGLNNSGVFAGHATVTVPATRGKGTTTTTTAFRHDGTFQPIAGSRSVAFGMCLNEAGDVAYFDSSYKSMLLHTGFAPDYAEQQFSLSNAIAADDPLKSEFVNSEPGVYAINDRGVTGYPQLVCRMAVSDGNGGSINRAVILTPYLVLP